MDTEEDRSTGAPEPVKEGAHWLRWLAPLAAGAAITVAGGATVLALIAGRGRSTMGATCSTKLEWQQRRQQMEQALLEHRGRQGQKPWTEQDEREQSE